MNEHRNSSNISFKVWLMDASRFGLPPHFAYLQTFLIFRKRMEALSGGLGGLVIDNDLEKPEVDRINIFHDFVKKKIQV